MLPNSAKGEHPSSADPVSALMLNASTLAKTEPSKKNVKRVYKMGTSKHRASARNKSSAFTKGPYSKLISKIMENTSKFAKSYQIGTKNRMQPHAWKTQSKRKLTQSDKCLK